MKFTNKFFPLLLTILAALSVCVLSASAQSPGRYDMVLSAGGAANGGTNNVAVSATNTYASFDVSEHDYVGVQATLKGTGAATSTVQLLGFKALGSTFETTPSSITLITLNGTTAVSTIVDVSVPTAGTYYFKIGNTNASVGVTNVAFERRIKSVKVDTRR